MVFRQRSFPLECTGCALFVINVCGDPKVTKHTAECHAQRNALGLEKKKNNSDDMKMTLIVLLPPTGDMVKEREGADSR